jgi:hypothetical protein
VNVADDVTGAMSSLHAKGEGSQKALKEHSWFLVAFSCLPAGNKTIPINYLSRR